MSFIFCQSLNWRVGLLKGVFNPQLLPYPPSLPRLGWREPLPPVPFCAFLFSAFTSIVYVVNLLYYNVSYVLILYFNFLCCAFDTHNKRLLLLLMPSTRRRDHSLVSNSLTQRLLRLKL